MNVKSLVPNALTMGNLLGGTYVCWTAASGGDLTSGVVAVVWLGAMILDLLDGLVARLLNVDGVMGLQLDSLADLITGGMAPAFVAYSIIHESGARDSVIMLTPWLILMAAAYRLARFNADSLNKDEESGFFKGLPAPAAGLYWLGVMMWRSELGGAADMNVNFELQALALVAGLGLTALPLLMVSRVKMLSMKTWGKDQKTDRIRFVFIAVCGIVFIATWFAWVNVFAAVPLCVLLYSCFALVVAPKQK